MVTIRKLAFLLVCCGAFVSLQSQGVGARSMMCSAGNRNDAGCSATAEVGGCDYCGEAFAACTIFCNSGGGWNCAGPGLLTGMYCDEVEPWGTSPDPVICECSCGRECIN